MHVVRRAEGHARLIPCSRIVRLPGLEGKLTLLTLINFKLLLLCLPFPTPTTLSHSAMGHTQTQSGRNSQLFLFNPFASELFDFSYTVWCVFNLLYGIKCSLCRWSCVTDSLQTLEKFALCIFRLCCRESRKRLALQLIVNC